jgi:hypothetical protein
VPLTDTPKEEPSELHLCLKKISPHLSCCYSLFDSTMNLVLSSHRSAFANCLFRLNKDNFIYLSKDIGSYSCCLISTRKSFSFNSHTDFDKVNTILEDCFLVKLSLNEFTVHFWANFLWNVFSLNQLRYFFFLHLCYDSMTASFLILLIFCWLINCSFIFILNFL